MVEGIYTKQKGTTFQDVIWETLKSLKEKSSNEFRTPQKKIIVHDNWNETILEGDSRKEFCQLVEFLSDILQQEFKKEIKEEYDIIFNAVKEERNKLNKKEISSENYVVFKVDKMRELLRLIMNNMKLNKYNIQTGKISKEEIQQ